ncbi:MAG: succinate--CoA ligase subunit alpha [Candidatus Heimdallarchaeota archaeon]|nr:succinate--CoA ligase subunit alpha [Candidatus Heimdallarchaeota archaeon]MCG3255743.1 succinate--CoA ligase subunit alpha [Candidatus Heimdallarchaeota archaeon]MCK4610817.1 succinate--CoA ligase subunit alpha [Candidatus Heimdallarchaeota archaeon]
MAILLGENTKVIVQGITGKQGTFHAKSMIGYGTKVVAGVTPGKGGQEHLGVPVFDSMKEAVEATQATASVIFIPARFTYSAAMEAIDAGINLLTVITEGVPVQDSARIRQKALDNDVVMVGPNCPGLITPEASKIGIIPGKICTKGNVGIVSRSGTLTYEIIQNLTVNGFGQSTCVGLGGDPIKGIGFNECLTLFENDPLTKQIILVGEIGGTGEQQAADLVKKEITKPVYAFIAGQTAPPGKQMGHAGAIVHGKSGTAKEKMRILSEAGITTVKTSSEIPLRIKENL